MPKNTNNKRYEWNLKLLYSSITDPQIEKDVTELETSYSAFSQKWNIEDKSYLDNDKKLLEFLNEYETLINKGEPKPLLYLEYILAINSGNEKAQALLNLLSNRITKAGNNLTFIDIVIGSLTKERQESILNNPDFSRYRFFLKCIFDDAKHLLTESEEKILNLKSQTSSQMWNQSHEKILSAVMVDWKGKKIPLAEAHNSIANLKYADRVKLSKNINNELKKVASFSEAEINAVVTDKKIEDELRGYKTPYENTVRRYRNDPKTVELLVNVVTKNFPVSNKFFKLKARLLKQKYLNYFDRNVKAGNIQGNFTFESSKEIIEKVFAGFDKKYADILNSYIKNGQIDVFPRKGKRGGAFCSGSIVAPTYVMLNHIKDLNSLSTFAHEMGHAFHTELSKKHQPAMYMHYSTSLAEVASTFFESLVFEEIIKTLPKKQQILALEQKINDDIKTIFRQIACFNYEKDIHELVRTKGFVSKEELSEMHNKNMKAYLGPIFKMTPDDGYFFVQWEHLRYFFYVYSYAYGQLVSKALLKRYREDKNFIASIEKYLSAGGKDTPENILKEIGLDLTDGKVFQDGIDEIKRDVKRLEEMMN